MTVLAAGHNAHKQLNTEEPLGMDGSSSPVAMRPEWDSMTGVVFSSEHAVGLEVVNGIVVPSFVGGNEYYADANPEHPEQLVAEPVPMKLPELQSFLMPESHGTWIDKNGMPGTHASNNCGQAGIGVPVPLIGGEGPREPPYVYSTPQRPIGLPAGVKAKLFSGGQFHDVLVLANGDAYAWGLNRSGQLGDGTRIPRDAPVKIGVIGVTAIAFGNEHSLFLHTNKRVSGCGLAVQGQLGRPGKNFLSPVDIGLEGVTAISAHGHQSAFLDVAGRVFKAGVFDVETEAPSQGVVEVKLEVPAIAIACGRNHLMILTAEGPFAIGENRWRQLGDGTRDFASQAVPIDLGAPCKGIAAGPYNSAWIV